MELWKKSLLLFLILTMLFAFSACASGDTQVVENKAKEGSVSQTQNAEVSIGKDVGVVDKTAEEDILGTWVMKYSGTDVINRMIAARIGEDIALPETQINMVFTLTFEKNGKFALSLALDRDSFDDYLAELAANMTAQLIKLAQSQGTTEAQLEEKCLEDYGMRLEEYVHSTLKESTKDSAERFPSVSYEGCYDQEASKIWLAEDEAALEKTEDYILASLEGNTLTVNRYGGDTMDSLREAAEWVGMSLPWVFERQ